MKINSNSSKGTELILSFINLVDAISWHKAGKVVIIETTEEIFINNRIGNEFVEEIIKMYWIFKAVTKRMMKVNINYLG